MKGRTSKIAEAEEDLLEIEEDIKAGTMMDPGEISETGPKDASIVAKRVILPKTAQSVINHSLSQKTKRI